jgi:hypothetical protein
METLVSIALILTVSYCIIVAFSAATRANLKSIAAIKTANKILETDRFIREMADSLHVPYWLKPEESIAEFKNELWRSKAGKYIQEITTLYDSSDLPRGVTVGYTIGTRHIKTSALFPFLQVTERQK